ncbi:hypothetical protein [Pseudolabrys sp. Root1462]|uniref:hypothetical protein n=1 Tax=Pseudolabrys sp. Root1462 TaxID=1736466 RepID=UPI0012E3FA63|nr:hypothetical protein [Pseudolabrys sp. Root1462]
MSARFNNLRIVRQVPTAGEAIAGWIGLLFALLLVVLVGSLLGQFFPQSYG